MQITYKDLYNYLYNELTSIGYVPTTQEINDIILVIAEYMVTRGVAKEEGE